MFHGHAVDSQERMHPESQEEALTWGVLPAPSLDAHGLCAPSSQTGYEIPGHPVSAATTTTSAYTMKLPSPQTAAPTQPHLHPQPHLQRPPRDEQDAMLQRLYCSDSDSDDYRNLRAASSNQLHSPITCFR